MLAHPLLHKNSLKARLAFVSLNVKPIVLAVAAGLAGVSAHAGSCNVTIAGAATCAVPSGVTSVTVVATGGGGGATDNFDGGSGAVVTATLTGVGGTSLNLYVGGGGGGSFGCACMAGGGGSSNVNAGTASQIIAGGGGGAGSGGAGGTGNGGNGAGGGLGGAGGIGGAGGSVGVPAGGSGNGGAGGHANGGGGTGLGAGSGGNGSGATGGGGGGGYGGGGAGDAGGGGGGGASTGGSITLASNGGSSTLHTSGSRGSIVVTWADPAAVPAPPIPSLGNLPPVPGIGTQPAVLDLSANKGPTMTTCLLATVRGLLGADAQYVGQGTNGVAKFSQGGRTLSFYPLQADTFTSFGAHVNLTGSNALTVGTTCGTFTVGPAMSNLTEFGALLGGLGLQANINSQGVFTMTAGNTVYMFRPDYLVAGGTPGAPSLKQGADGLYRFTDSAGNVQILRPAFADTDGLANLVTSALSQNGSISIQTDGTAFFSTVGGQQYVLTPDLTLTPALGANASKLWWQDLPNHYLVRSSVFTMAQGFTAQQR